jgi:hypothetical protein
VETLNGYKELKVRLRLGLLLELHTLKLTRSRGYSEVINQALDEYLKRLDRLDPGPTAQERPPEPKRSPP